ncbi:hypothetical protein TNCV_1046491 [Trichonephila clavipes]|nr:hypothetical protein TNCV_1046491 [Trichonephila clavipes]
MNQAVLTEYNGDQMTREMRGRHNKEVQFVPEKAEKGTIVHTSRSEQDQAKRMPDEEVINNGKARKGEERVQSNPCHWRSCEGATCVWMVTDEAGGSKRAFLTMWRSFQRLISRDRPESCLHVNDISLIHWSKHLLTTPSERSN